MKIKILLIAIIVIATTITTMAQDESASILTLTSQPVPITIVQKDSSATLSCSAEKGVAEISYQWYLSTDGTTNTGITILGAESSEYTTEPFDEKGIRYYYCVAMSEEEMPVFTDVVAVAYTGLPTLYINTEIPTKDITKTEYAFGDMKLIYESGEEFTYTFKTEKDGEKKEGIKGRGNTSWSMPKKGYNIKFDKKQSFFNLPASKKWCINANYADKTLLRNKFASLLGNEIFNSEWNPTFINLDVVMNGEYMGNYTFMEKNVIGDGRIDIQDISDCTEKKISKGDYTDQNGDGKIDLYDGGFVIEIDNRMDAEFTFRTSKSIPISLKDPDEVSVDIQEHIKHIVQQAEDALFADNYTDENDGWRKYFDEESVIDWYLINEFAFNRDAPHNSSIYKYYSSIDGKLHFGPLWDFDLGFGNDGENGTNIYSLGDPTVWWVIRGYWIVRMFEDPVFLNNIKRRWNEKKSELFTFINSNLQRLADDNVLSAIVNFQEWPILGKYVWPNAVGFENRKTYQSEIDYMKNWLNERYTWLDAALNNSYTINYDLCDGTLIIPNLDVFISENTESYTLNNPERDGYIFVGWIGTGLNGVTQSVTLTDDHLGDRTFTAVWQKRKDITLCDLVIADVTYTGENENPNIMITDGLRPLLANTDYTIVFPNDCINVGQYTVTITGIGSYTGSTTETFSILPKTIDNPIITLSETSFTYDGTAKTPEVFVKDGETVISSNEYNVTYIDNTNEGTATVTINDVDGGNYTVNGIATFDIVYEYNAPSYVWSEGYLTCTATKIGVNDKIPVITETVNPTSDTISATCEMAGSVTYTADFSRHEFEKQETTVFMATLGHTIVVDSVVAPTCTKSGMAIGIHCSVCHTVFLAQDSIPATGHIVAAAVAENLKAATCTATGSVDSVVYCTVCKAEISRKTVEIPVIPHTAGESIAENLKAATCTAVGSVDSVVYCTICKAEISRKTVEIPVIPHTPGEAVNLTEATCTEAGSVDTMVYCTVCKAEISHSKIEISARGHDEIADAAVAATCTESGKTEGSHCSVCGEVIVAQTEIPALGHKFENYVYNNDATTEADGTETAICEHGCGATDTRTAVGTKLESTVAISESAADNLVVYAYGNTIVVENAENDIYVYDAMGRLIVETPHCDVSTEIRINRAGVYIVKTGNTAKRVMIND